MNPTDNRANLHPPNFQPAMPKNPAITIQGRAGMSHGS